MAAQTMNIDWDAVHCNPAHLKTTGRGWARRLRELGMPDDEIQMLVQRLKNGMAAEIELGRIKELSRLTRVVNERQKARR